MPPFVLSRVPQPPVSFQTFTFIENSPSFLTFVTQRANFQTTPKGCQINCSAGSKYSFIHLSLVKPFMHILEC